ncbi:hypothetical protein [Sphaerisporangium corydalis]|uniref:Uncharacterized protein n=1 Tax=Sphaerisporangium corydalis TaxID=1441875 RepID=A0ABV9E7C0_9ACTN|nr:hypothetical protein [Sphaerisporangium corydalis]
MRKTVRTVWIAAGGALTALAVIGMALGTWSSISLPHSYDFAFPGSYDSADLGRETSETSTVTYTITAPLVIVDVTGPIGVRVASGTAGRLSVRRELTWVDGDRDFGETWENGRTLRAFLSCDADHATGLPRCHGDYVLRVPPAVDVLLVTSSGTARCTPTPAEADCAPGAPS